MAVPLRPSPNALLNPCADPIFKSLFTQENPKSRKALSCFLSALLGKAISDVVLQPNELSVEAYLDRQTQFDLTCKVNSEPVNIEMQGINLHSLYQNRAEYHVAHLLNHYVSKGMDETDIPKVYQISVVNFLINKDSDTSYNHFIMKNTNEDGSVLGNRMNVIFLELPKIKELQDDVNKLTEVEQWGKFFLYANDSEKQEFLKELGKVNPGIQSAMETLDFLSKDELEWQRETSYWRYVMDVTTAKNEAKRTGYAEGHAEGHEDGFAEGQAEGRAEGRAEGLAEGQLSTKKEIALKLKLLKLPLQQIADATGLTEKEIKSL